MLGRRGRLADRDACTRIRATSRPISRRWYRNLPPIPEPPPPRPRAQLLRLGPARAAITATALAQAAMVGVMSITSVELGDHGWADWQVQLLMAAHFVGMFALAYPVGPAGRPHRPPPHEPARPRPSARSARSARPLTGASPLITPFFFLLGLGWAGCFVAGTSILADITSPRERGVLTASNDLIVAVLRGRGVALAQACCSRAPATGRWASSSARCSSVAVPGLLRLQEPTVGVYVEPPAADARRPQPA